MPKPKFEVDYSKLLTAQGKPLSTATIAIYKAALNKLAVIGYKTKADLLKHSTVIVKYIEDSEKEKNKRRVILSAIFRVLQDEPNDKREPFYKAFQRAKDEE